MQVVRSPQASPSQASENNGGYQVDHKRVESLHQPSVTGKCGHGIVALPLAAGVQSGVTPGDLVLSFIMIPMDVDLIRAILLHDNWTYPLQHALLLQGDFEYL